MEKGKYIEVKESKVKAGEESIPEKYPGLGIYINKNETGNTIVAVYKMGETNYVLYLGDLDDIESIGEIKEFKKTIAAKKEDPIDNRIELVNKNEEKTVSESFALDIIKTTIREMK